MRALIITAAVVAALAVMAMTTVQVAFTCNFDTSECAPADAREHFVRGRALTWDARPLADTELTLHGVSGVRARLLTDSQGSFCARIKEEANQVSVAGFAKTTSDKPQISIDSGRGAIAQPGPGPPRAIFRNPDDPAAVAVLPTARCHVVAARGLWYQREGASGSSEYKVLMALPGAALLMLALAGVWAARRRWLTRLGVGFAAAAVLAWLFLTVAPQVTTAGPGKTIPNPEVAEGRAAVLPDPTPDQVAEVRRLQRKARAVADAVDACYARTRDYRRCDTPSELRRPGLALARGKRLPLDVVTITTHYRHDYALTIATKNGRYAITRSKTYKRSETCSTSTSVYCPDGVVD